MQEPAQSGRNTAATYTKSCCLSAVHRKQLMFTQPPDDALPATCVMQDLQNDLADRCEELRAAQRKLVMARTASSAAAEAGGAGAGAGPATPANAVKRCVIARLWRGAWPYA